MILCFLVLLKLGMNSSLVCQFGLSRSGLYAVAEWYVAGIGRKCKQFKGGCIENICLSTYRTKYRFVTLEALRLEILKEALDRCQELEALHWIQLRDPYNWYSSLYQGVKCGSVRWYGPVSLDKWKDYAKLCLESDRWINYNRWFNDDEYRRDLAKRFGFVQYCDGEPWQHIPLRGGGSTFDRGKFTDHAQEMDVLKRYIHSIDDPSWRNQFDSDVVFLAQKLFDMERPW